MGGGCSMSNALIGIFDCFESLILLPSSLKQLKFVTLCVFLTSTNLNSFIFFGFLLDLCESYHEYALGWC